MRRTAGPSSRNCVAVGWAMARRRARRPAPAAAGARASRRAAIGAQAGWRVAGGLHAGAAGMLIRAFYHCATALQELPCHLPKFPPRPSSRPCVAARRGQRPALEGQGAQARRGLSRPGAVAPDGPWRCRWRAWATCPAARRRPGAGPARADPAGALWPARADLARPQRARHRRAGRRALTLRFGADGALAALQAEVAGALGLAALELRAHKLLVYGPGQFFKPHQDTEKHPGMVGTLNWSARISAASCACSMAMRRSCCIAASARHRAALVRLCSDCRHEVLPVAEGWRVVLTFDLVVPATARSPAQRPSRRCWRCCATSAPAGPAQHPALGVSARSRIQPARPALGAAQEDDRPRVLALRAAAQALGLQMYLALAEIHENWTASYSAPRGPPTTPTTTATPSRTN